MLMSIFFWLVLLAYFYLYIFYKSESIVFRYIAQFYATLKITIFFRGNDFSYIDFILFFVFLSVVAYSLQVALAIFKPKTD